jgi:hypothetical protein
MRVHQRKGGLGVELAPGDDRARHRRGERQLREAPSVKHRGHDHRDLLGAPRSPVKDRLECLRSAAGVAGALGCSGGSRRQEDGLAPGLGAFGLSALVPGDHRLDRQFLPSGIGPRDDPHRVGRIGQRPLDGRRELLVVDDGDRSPGRLPRHDLRQRRACEGGVQQQHVGADAVRRDQRIDEATVVSGHDPDHAGRAAGQRLQRGRERVGALVDLAPRQHADLVDQTGPVRTPLSGGRETRSDAHVLARHGGGDPEVLVGPQRCDDACPGHGGDQAERAGQPVGERHQVSPAPAGGVPWPVGPEPAA